MPTEPQVKRTIAFIDGQNLFHAVKETFGYPFPNYDVAKLASKICLNKGWQLLQTRFYTGVPNLQDKPLWYHFWTAKLAQMGKKGVHTFSRPLRYRNQSITLPNGQTQTVLVGQEKGIDIRIALDLVRLTTENRCDITLVFSQDQDLSEAAEEIRLIAKQQERWIKIASAFPVSPTGKNRRGINKTDWVTIDRALYESCIDTRDYRPKVTEQKPV